MPQLHLATLPNIPLVRSGDDLLPMIRQGLVEAGLRLEAGDILVLASKIVSKSEGRMVSLDTVTPGTQARELAIRCGKDPREVECILRESVEVVRVRPGLLITRHRLGFVCANGGVDHSNVAPLAEPACGAGACVLLLPLDPDASAQRLRVRLKEAIGVPVGIVIADSHGRPHRNGAIGVAIGAAGLPALEDLRGRTDLFGYVLQHTEMGTADMIASAATLLLGQANEGTPIVHVRGAPHSPGAGAGHDLVRAKDKDLFL